MTGRAVAIELSCRPLAAGAPMRVVPALGVTGGAAQPELERDHRPQPGRDDRLDHQVEALTLGLGVEFGHRAR